MRINLSDVQFEHYTPDPARGMGRTSKRFKAGDKLEIWTDEKTIFITAGARTIAVPYGRAIWLEHGPEESSPNPGRGKRTRKKAKRAWTFASSSFRSRERSWTTRARRR